MFLDAGVLELVVRTATDDLRRQRRHRLVRQRATQGAGCVDVHRLADQRVGVDDVDLGVEHPDPVERVPVDVRDHHRSAVLEKVLDEVMPDLADSFDAHAPAAQRRRTPGVLARCAHAFKNAVRRKDRRVTSPSVRRTRRR